MLNKFINVYLKKNAFFNLVRKNMLYHIHKLK